MLRLKVGRQETLALVYEAYWLLPIVMQLQRAQHFWESNNFVDL